MLLHLHTQTKLSHILFTLYLSILAKSLHPRYSETQRTRDMEMSKFSEPDFIDQSTQALPLPSIPDSSSGSTSRHNNHDSEARPPHESLLLVLPYLPVFELLVMSETCKTLSDAVKKDVLPWLNVTVERPLNRRLSNEMLIEITSRADGRLKDLVLINCAKITDDGLQRVIAKNLFISKLHVPGCTGLTPEGIIQAVKTLSQLSNGLKSLQINGVYNIKKEHLETLRSCIRINPIYEKPRHLLYHNYRTLFSSGNDESGVTIDIEICPKCNEVRMVFNCSRETCKKKNKSYGPCRGCIFCVPRCEECGVCVDAEEMEDTLCLDTLCSDCWLHLPKCSFCNKPYCPRHAIWQNGSPGSACFICEVCHGKIQTLS